MALQIVWTPDAKLHLNEILKYWIERNGTPAYSIKLYNSIKTILQVLSKYPESGKITERPFLRSKIVKDYYIFYYFNDKQLSIVGVCDMRRDPKYIESIM